MSATDAWNTWYAKHQAQTNGPGDTTGLDPSQLSTTTIGGSPGRAASWMDSGYGGTPGVSATKYNGPGGTWTNTGGGWTSGTGQKVNNLAGYLGMQKNLQSGANFEPYQQGVNTAISGMTNANQQYQNLLNDPSKVNQTAGYQFALDQGNQAINRSAAAKGMLNSGNVLAELAKYGQGMGSQLYQQQLGNYQQNFQNQGNTVNTLGNLMQNAQQFGLNAGYYNPVMPNAAINPSKPSIW